MNSDDAGFEAWKRDRIEQLIAQARAELGYDPEADLAADKKAMLAALGRYTCPRCGAISRNPNDIAQRYCGRCHRYEEPVNRYTIEMELPSREGGNHSLAVDIADEFPLPRIGETVIFDGVPILQVQITDVNHFVNSLQADEVADRAPGRGLIVCAEDPVGSELSDAHMREVVAMLRGCPSVVAIRWPQGKVNA